MSVTTPPQLSVCQCLPSKNVHGVHACALTVNNRTQIALRRYLYMVFLLSYGRTAMVMDLSPVLPLPAILVFDGFSEAALSIPRDPHPIDIYGFAALNVPLFTDFALYGDPTDIPAVPKPPPPDPMPPATSQRVFADPQLGDNDGGSNPGPVKIVEHSMLPDVTTRDTINAAITLALSVTLTVDPSLPVAVFFQTNMPPELRTDVQPARVLIIVDESADAPISNNVSPATIPEGKLTEYTDPLLVPPVTAAVALSMLGSGRGALSNPTGIGIMQQCLQ